MSDGEISRGSARAVLSFGAVLALLSVAYFASMYVMSRPRLDSVTSPQLIRVGYTSDTLSMDPRAPQWRAIEPISVALVPQAARAPFGTQEREVLLRAVYNDREIAFLLEYADDTEDRAGAPRPDGCAVMLTPDPGPATAQMMGHGGSANIWHWMADSVARNLVATGPGTQAESGLGTVEAYGSYTDGRWSVVFRRPLVSSHPDELAVTAEHSMSVSFAVWDGSREEGLSAKSISALRPLRLGGR